MRLKLPPARKDSSGATHLKGGGLKKFFHKPLGNRSGPVRSTLRKVEKVTRKEILPVALPIAGYMIGGPLGGMAGGAMAGAVRSSQNVGKNMLKGAMKGLAITGGMHLAGNLAGAGGGLGSLANLIPGMGTGTGAGAAQGLTGARGEVFKQLSKVAGVGGGKGLGGLLGGFGSLGISPMDALLGATAIGGTLGGREKVDKRDQEKYEQLMSPRSPYDNVPMPTYSPYMRQPNPDYFRDVHNIDVPLGGQSAFLDNRNPQMRATGGYVHGGYIHGDSGGQDDDFETHIPAGSYVMDATTVSALGDGNSGSGRKKIQELREMFSDSGIIPHHQWIPQHAVHVKLSPGEDVLEPEVVRAIGKGSEKRGVKELDNMRKKLRAEKGMKKFLPPKTKPLKSYLR
jgi:hypothetical protein